MPLSPEARLRNPSNRWLVEEHGRLKPEVVVGCSARRGAEIRFGLSEDITVGLTAPVAQFRPYILCD